MKVGVRELRQNLSVYLRRVKAGETLEVTEHGRSVAVLAPLAQRSSVWERWLSEGRITPAAEGPGSFEPLDESAPLDEGVTGDALLALLREQRRDRY